MSASDILIRLIVVLNLPRLTKDLITYARAVNVALLGNSRFPSPTPPLDVFAAHIGELEEAETNAETRAKGTASLRDAKVLVGDVNREFRSQDRRAERRKGDRAGLSALLLSERSPRWR